MEEKKYEKINKKQKEAIESYLESRLGVYGIKSYEFKWDYDEHRIYKESAKQILEEKSLGIFKHMIKEAYLIVEIWGSDTMKNVGIAFRYEHKPNGSNGHGTDIKLECHEDGTLYEV